MLDEHDECVCCYQPINWLNNHRCRHDPTFPIYEHELKAKEDRINRELERAKERDQEDLKHVQQPSD